LFQLDKDYSFLYQIISICQAKKSKFRKRSLFAAQNIFSTILEFASLQLQNAPFGLKHWLCGRSASLRMVTEKILIRTQSFLFQFLGDQFLRSLENTVVPKGSQGEKHVFSWQFLTFSLPIIVTSLLPGGRGMKKR
jgi:hypothetical protein